eukprot:2948495-Prorocentrum_lima.AAC.1
MARQVLSVDAIGGLHGDDLAAHDHVPLASNAPGSVKEVQFQCCTMHLAPLEGSEASREVDAVFSLLEKRLGDLRRQH